ncbi:capsid assembly scaffolding protein Gp46 family protein [Streptococcus phocae subsp. phocae]
MSDFKVIETQEELDTIVKARIAREREKYQDYDQLKSRVEELENEKSSLENALNDAKSNTDSYTEKITNLENQIAGYETANLRTRVALQYGLPIDLADRLQGDDEDGLKTDAERLASFIKPSQPQPPAKSNEPAIGDDKSIAMKQLVSNLTNKGE